VIEGRSLRDFEAMIDYVANEILGSFDRDGLRASRRAEREGDHSGASPVV
jgi:hypothetical protein